MITFIGMGNAESTKKKEQIRTRPQHGAQIKHGKMPCDAKNILLLHKSNMAQLEVIYNFRAALITKTEGTVEVTDFVNIADERESSIPHGQAWLDELHNVVLICLTPEAVTEFHKIILEKGFADQNGRLHPKVFTFTFGESLSSQWPPKGLKKGSPDLRDFHFGFSDVEKLRPKDFEKSLRLNSLIAAIKLTR